MHLFRTIQKSRATRKLLKDIQAFSNQKKLIEAIEIAENIIKNWYYEPNWKKWLFLDLFTGESCKSLIKKISTWKFLVESSNELIRLAKELEESFLNDPERADALSKSLEFFQKSLDIVENSNIRDSFIKCSKKLSDCQEYFKLFNLSKEYAIQLQFQDALKILNEANFFFDTSNLQELKSIYQSKVKEEKSYLESLAKVHKIISDGSFEEALNIFTPTWNCFPRSDGKRLISKLQNLIKGQKIYQIARIAEENRDYRLAITNYKESLKLLPKVQYINFRLVITLIKTEQFEAALSLLNQLEGEQVIYLKGLIYTKQKQWEQAKAQWLKILSPVVKPQLEQLEICIESQKYEYFKNIENLVKSEQLELASKISLEYLQSFGQDENVEYNLVNYIQPSIQKELWQKGDWILLANQSQKKWLKEYDPHELHNWAIACYREGLENSSNLPEMFMVWMIVLANLQRDPVLKDIPWLLGVTPDIQSLAQRILLLLESTLENIKESKPLEYLSLRDLFRCDLAAWRLLKNSYPFEMTFHQYFITPSIFNKFTTEFKQTTLPRQIWATLYTKWGQQVAACLEGDFKRAIQITVNSQPQNELERFAQSYIDYQFACNFLKEYQWKKSFDYIKKIKSYSKIESDWYIQLDLLCQNQRKEIEAYSEHLSFSKGWYELLGTREAKRYYVDYKVEELAQKLGKEQISLGEAARALKSFKEIDPQNGLVLDLLQKINFIQESDRVFSLLKQGNAQEAVTVALNSSNLELRYHLASILMEFFQKNERTFSYSQRQDLLRWIRQLSPSLF